MQLLLKTTVEEVAPSKINVLFSLSVKAFSASVHEIFNFARIIELHSIFLFLIPEHYKLFTMPDQHLGIHVLLLTSKVGAVLSTCLPPM